MGNESCYDATMAAIGLFSSVIIPWDSFRTCGPSSTEVSFGTWLVVLCRCLFSPFPGVWLCRSGIAVLYGSMLMGSGPAMLSSDVAPPLSLPSAACEGPAFLTPGPVLVCPSPQPSPWRGQVSAVVLIGIFLMTKVQRLSCARWPFVFHLWRNVYSHSVPIT